MIPSENQREKILDYLADRSASDLAHTGRHLLDHLIGVERLLAHWGAPSHVQIAGLLHSVYGTQRFAKPVTDDRAEVERLAGSAASELISAFCDMDRSSLRTSLQTGKIDICDRSQAPLACDTPTFRNLVMLYAANAAEALPRTPRSRTSRELREDYPFLRPLLPGIAQADLDRLLANRLIQLRGLFQAVKSKLR